MAESRRLLPANGKGVALWLRFIRSSRSAWTPTVMKAREDCAGPSTRSHQPHSNLLSRFRQKDGLLVVHGNEWRAHALRDRHRLTIKVGRCTLGEACHHAKGEASRLWQRPITARKCPRTKLLNTVNETLPSTPVLCRQHQTKKITRLTARP